MIVQDTNSSRLLLRSGRPEATRTAVILLFLIEVVVGGAVAIWQIFVFGANLLPFDALHVDLRPALATSERSINDFVEAYSVAPIIAGFILAVLVSVAMNVPFEGMPALGLAIASQLGYLAVSFAGEIVIRAILFAADWPGAPRFLWPNLLFQGMLLVVVLWFNGPRWNIKNGRKIRPAVSVLASTAMFLVICAIGYGIVAITSS